MKMKRYLVFLALIFSNFVCLAGLRIVGIGAQTEEIKPLDPSALYDFIRVGNIAAVQELITKYPTCIESRDSSGQTPLILISNPYGVKQPEEFRLEAAQLLLDHGADVNACEELLLKYSALHYAASYNINLVKLLLAAPNININIRDALKRTAFSIAIAKGRVDIAELLMSAGADVHLDNGLWEAILNCQIDAVKFLINIGIEKNALNWQGDTVLDYIYSTACFNSSRGFKRTGVDSMIKFLKSEGFLTSSELRKQQAAAEPENTQVSVVDQLTKCVIQ